jgi:exonuclease VII small subunit
MDDLRACAKELAQAEDRIKEQGKEQGKEQENNREHGEMER